MPEAELRCRTNQRWTVETDGPYTSPTPSPTSTQEALRNNVSEDDSRLLARKPSASSTMPTPVTVRTEVLSLHAPENTPTT
jgi:hypothetical protein